jgi:hypothetical protein
VSANLLELEAEPTRALLDSVELEGLTAHRWGEASRTLAGLFLSFQSIKSLLDDATVRRQSWAIATQSRIDQLRVMLLGCSIERSDIALPIGERALLDGSRVVDRCTPDELLREMSASFDDVKAVLFGVSECWAELPPRFRSMRQRLWKLDEATRSGLEQPLADLARQVMADPLGVDRSLVDAVERELVGLEALAHDTDDELAAARELVASLPAAVARAHHDRAAAAERFVAHHLPESVELDGTLAARVDALEPLIAARSWREVSAELTAIRLAAAALVDRAERTEGCRNALIAQRNELRGRLHALEAKAGARDRVEDPELWDLYEQARTELYTAPTDLDRAGALVQAYGDALHGAAR